MKLFIVFLCISGIAFVSAAPIEESYETRAVEEQEAVTNTNLEAQERVAIDGAAESPASEENARERGLIPSAREIIRALENKYLSDDGKALLKSVMPVG